MRQKAQFVRLLACTPFYTKEYLITDSTVLTATGKDLYLTFFWQGVELNKIVSFPDLNAYETFLKLCMTPTSNSPC